MTLTQVAKVSPGKAIKLGEKKLKAPEVAKSMFADYQN